MRIQLQNLHARALGDECRAFANQFTQAQEEQGFSHDLAQRVERTFHSLGTESQMNRFVVPLWDLVDQDLQTISYERRSTPKKITGRTYPIIPGFKEAPDLIIKIVSTNGEITIPEIDVQKGGLASNIVEALALFDTPAYIPSLHGNANNKLSEIHRALMESSGIDTSMLVPTIANSYLHTCFYLVNGHEKDYWMSQAREPFHRDELDAFTHLIRQCCEENKGEVLVLSALPPTGSGDHYFPELIDIAGKNGNPVFFNPKQYDYLNRDKGNFLSHLFLQNKLTLIKPNLDEFVQLLKFAYLIPETEAKALHAALKQETDNKRFETLEKFGLDLLSKLKENGILIISLGSNGAVLLSRNYRIYSSAPEINSADGCPSGAGDSGLAALIMETRNKGISLNKDLSEDDSRSLLRVFIDEASATASLPGNRIAGPEELALIKQQDLLTQVKKLRRK